MKNLNELRLQIAIETHLRYNHYPPLPVIMADTCRRAIKYARRGEWEHEVRMPKGMTYLDKKTCPVSVIVEMHDLDCFLE